MRIEQLQFLIEIARHQSINVASEFCYTTPQNVSKSIRSLEKEFGVTLFNRTRQGIILTPDGERVLKSARIIVDEANRLNSYYLPTRKNSSNIQLQDFSILSTEPLFSLSEIILTELLKSFPDINTALIQAEPPFLNSTDDFITFVKEKSKSYHLIFTTLDDYNYDSFPSLSNDFSIYSLMKDHLYLELHKDHPYAKKKSIPLKSVITIPLVAFGVTRNTVPFCYGALERRYNIHLKPKLLSNHPNVLNRFPMLKDYALLRGSCGWTPNDQTILVPIQETCIIHHAMLIPNNSNQELLYEKIFPLIFHRFPNLYKIS